MARPSSARPCGLREFPRPSVSHRVLPLVARAARLLRSRSALSALVSSLSLLSPHALRSPAGRRPRSPRSWFPCLCRSLLALVARVRSRASLRSLSRSRSSAGASSRPLARSTPRTPRSLRSLRPLPLPPRSSLSHLRAPSFGGGRVGSPSARRPARPLGSLRVSSRRGRSVAPLPRGRTNNPPRLRPAGRYNFWLFREKFLRS